MTRLIPTLAAGLGLALAAGGQGPPASRPADPPTDRERIAELEARVAALEARLFPAPAAKPPAAPAPAPAARTGYPLRPSSSWWTGCPDWTHLARGEHAGRFPSAWLQTLTPAEVQSLHSDLHENRVQWSFVPGGRAEASAPVATFAPVTYGASACPTGVCPTGTGPVRRILFRR